MITHNQREWNISTIQNALQHGEQATETCIVKLDGIDYVCEQNKTGVWVTK